MNTTQLTTGTLSASVSALHGIYELPAKKTGIVIPSTYNEHSQYEIGKETTKKVTLASKKLLAPITYQSKMLMARFGGYTVSPQEGGWIDSDNGELVEEKSLFIWAYANPANDDVVALITLAQSVKAMLHQDSILIVIDDVPYLV